MNGSNFRFLADNYPTLSNLGALAEKSLYVDPSNTLGKLRIISEKIDQLPQAILAKAFKGELVEQLPTDGDARELLEEIKKLKAEAGGKKKKK